LVALVALAVSLVVPVGGAASAGASPSPDVSIRWNQTFLEAVETSTLGPPAVARGLAVLNTCMYDTWAAYDQAAVGTQLEGRLRRPRSEHLPAYQEPAINQAAFLAATDLVPGERPRFEQLMRDLGGDPARASHDPAIPEGVGRIACEAVLAFRHGDGANQLGDTPGSSGAPYSDYTGYQPVNEPDRLNRPDRWQPLGSEQFVMPHWPRVMPFALPQASQLRSPIGPARYGSRQYVDQAKALVDFNARLNDETKAIAEYWADGPGTVTPPGHWMEIATFCAERDGMDLAGNVKMFFSVATALFDAGIAAWDSKVAYDYVRPISAIRFLYGGTTIDGWAGPGRGTRTISGRAWRPYITTPPFAEYPSGHSTFSAAASEILRSVTGKDVFGGSVEIPAGSSRIEPGITPSRDLTLSWPTFSAAAGQAGLSRRLGGIHFEQADTDGQALGTAAAALVWAKAQRLFAGISR
jgi:hypothetical protein